MKHRIREDKNEIARCPFCRERLQMPETIKTETDEFMGGRCSCGAVYAYDPTGHNVGEAYLDALQYACGGSSNNFDCLSPCNEYEEAVFGYDARSHKLRDVQDARRDCSAKIIFIRVVKKDK